ncbi:MAG: hypothetical protein BJ554DRAFT_6297, partial [Olpidium bornovanus]
DPPAGRGGRVGVGVGEGRGSALARARLTAENFLVPRRGLGGTFCLAPRRFRDPSYRAAKSLAKRFPTPGDPCEHSTTSRTRGGGGNTGRGAVCYSAEVPSRSRPSPAKKRFAGAPPSNPSLVRTIDVLLLLLLAVAGARSAPGGPPGAVFPLEKHREVQRAPPASGVREDRPAEAGGLADRPRTRRRPLAVDDGAAAGAAARGGPLDDRVVLGGGERAGGVDDPAAGGAGAQRLGEDKALLFRQGGRSRGRPPGEVGWRAQQVPLAGARRVDEHAVIAARPAREAVARPVPRDVDAPHADHGVDVAAAADHAGRQVLVQHPAEVLAALPVGLVHVEAAGRAQPHRKRERLAARGAAGVEHAVVRRDVQGLRRQERRQV